MVNTRVIFAPLIIHNRISMNKFLGLILVVSATMFFGCSEELPEVPENIHSAKDNVRAETHFFSMFDAAYDVIATNDKFRKSETSIIPSSVLLDFIDSSFKDGSGVSVTVDFGDVGFESPHGTLCQDGKYRAGKMHIFVNQSIQSIDFRAVITLDSVDGFYTGDGEHMVQLNGTTIITPADLNAMRVQMKNASLNDDGLVTKWTSDRVVRQIKDAGDDGIWGDEYEVTGKSSGINRDGKPYEVVITESLVKRMESGCANTFVSGQLEVYSKTSSQQILLNYDPSGDAPCDALIEANINGRKQVFETR